MKTFKKAGLTALVVTGLLGSTAHALECPTTQVEIVALQARLQEDVRAAQERLRAASGEEARDAREMLQNAQRELIAARKCTPVALPTRSGMRMLPFSSTSNTPNCLRDALAQPGAYVARNALGDRTLPRAVGSVNLRGWLRLDDKCLIQLKVFTHEDVTLGSAREFRLGAHQSSIEVVNQGGQRLTTRLLRITLEDDPTFSQIMCNEGFIEGDHPNARIDSCFDPAASSRYRPGLEFGRLVPEGELPSGRRHSVSDHRRAKPSSLDTPAGGSSGPKSSTAGSATSH